MSSFLLQRLILHALAQVLQQYVQSIFQLLNMIASDMNRSEALMRAAMGVIG
jgi:importin subunit beta-1